MATKTTRAAEYQPIGDPEHIAYGQAFYYTCTCGKSAPTFTRESRAEYLAENHEKYCNGTATVRVNE